MLPGVHLHRGIGPEPIKAVHVQVLVLDSFHTVDNLGEKRNVTRN